MRSPRSAAGQPAQEVGKDLHIAEAAWYFGPSFSKYGARCDGAWTAVVFESCATVACSVFAGVAVSQSMRRASLSFEHNERLIAMGSQRGGVKRGAADFTFRLLGAAGMLRAKR